MKTNIGKLSRSAPYYYILWGIIVATYSMAKYLAIMYDITTLQSASVLFLIGAILSYTHGKKDTNTISDTDKVYLKVWIVISIGLALINTIGLMLGVAYLIPMTLSLYCLGSLATGLFSGYIPSIAGAIVCLLCVFWSLYASNAEQFAIQAIAVSAVHTIPGLLMRRKFTPGKFFTE